MDPSDPEERADSGAKARIRATKGERSSTLTHLRQGTLLQANAPERVEKRKARLLASDNATPLLGLEAKTTLAEQPVLAAPSEVQRAFERQIGGKDTQPCWFLTRGAHLRRSIGRIHIRDRVRRVGWGTGFLIAPGLLVTNQHVLDSAETARCSQVELDYEETYEGGLLNSALFDLRPEVFFVWSPCVGGLDYAVVAVSPRARADCQRPDAQLAEFGHHTLIASEGKLLKGELINSVHHPEGQPRQVSLRENRLTAIEDAALTGTWMHYETDTEQGSSGAPLYNSQWEVVGIHHAGVEKRDADGNVLAIGGGIWSTEMGERQKWWEANEGLRISRFMADLGAQVSAARAGTASPERVVTDEGFKLFQGVTRPSSADAGTPSVPRSPAKPSPGDTKPRFNPD